MLVNGWAMLLGWCNPMFETGEAPGAKKIVAVAASWRQFEARPFAQCCVRVSSRHGKSCSEYRIVNLKHDDAWHAVHVCLVESVCMRRRASVSVTSYRTTMIAFQRCRASFYISLGIITLSGTKDDVA